MEKKQGRTQQNTGIKARDQTEIFKKSTRSTKNRVYYCLILIDIFFILQYDFFDILHIYNLNKFTAKGS